MWGLFRRPRGHGRATLPLILGALGLAALCVSSSTLIASAVRSAPSMAAPQPLSCAHAASGADPVRAENLCAGTRAWRQTEPTGPQNAIEGFMAPASVNVGQTVHLYVSTTAATYSFRVFRMGWYGGLGGRLVYTSPLERGIAQPAPTIDPATRMVSCAWRHPVALAIPQTWVSGIYMVKLYGSNGDVRYTSFVVRNDANHAPMLFQVGILTYQAYNAWGGYSLYAGRAYPGTSNPLMTYADRAYAVSFDRPNTIADSAGLGLEARWELNLVPWLESRGYNMSYLTDIDADQSPGLLLGHKLIIFGGHEEYWSSAMRQHVTSARDAGESLAFFVANSVYWRVRLAGSPLGSDRVVICYRAAALDPVAASNPSEATVRWRDAPINTPEDTLLGEMYLNETAVDTLAPLVLGPAAQPLLTGTGYTVGSQIPDLVGGEVDATVAGNVLPGLTTLASSPVPCYTSVICPPKMLITANTTIYTWPSGARVFDAGTFYWATGLDDQYPSPVTFTLKPQPGFQRLTENLLAYLV